ncbi:hypothetical protein NESM_000627200 [Novymonas esmeraldas]|uniref:Uncharacterized protein n=1 Tax=Novymonas esmeraldas TaxID=1808958 RepID=A0AAW0ETF6_9TRYP
MDAGSGSTPAEAPLHAAGEQFRCRVDVEDVVISVAGDAASITTGLFWEELRVVCKFNGITQRTRWLTLPAAIEEAKRELQHTSAPTQGLLPLPYTDFNNLSYEVMFTAEEAARGGDAAGGPAGAAPVRAVKPKRFHRMEFEVEAQNKHRLYSSSGGQTGDRAPTSGNMEVISASLNKGAAKVSAWTRSVFSKLGSSSSGGSSHGGGSGHDSRQQNAAALATLGGAHTGATAPAPPHTGAAAADDRVHEGTYVTVVKDIDASDAYNAAGGRQRFCLVVKPDSQKMPETGTGTPITIAFTLVAHFGQEKCVQRDFRDFVIVADQFVLDFSDAATELPPADPKEERAQPRSIVGYSFGYTANTSSASYTLEASSQTVPVAAALASDAPDGAAMVRVIDFDRLHREEDERKRCAEDYKALPTSCCIVSEATTRLPACRPQLGNRVVCVSRFKTSPDGLCKPSFKCQFAVSLVRYYGTYGESTREVGPPINLAALLNQEALPQRVRVIKFSLGEIMYLRLRRFCFANPALLGAPLLMPYDYNNDGVSLPAASTPPPPHVEGSERRAAATADQQRADTLADTRTSEPALPSPQEQRSSSSSSSSSAPAVETEVPSDNPFFTIEPAQPSSAVMEFGGDSTAHTATRASDAADSYPPSNAWTQHRGDAVAAFEITPSESNPFFSLQREDSSTAPPREPATRVAAAAAATQNPYDFGSADAAPHGEDDAAHQNVAAFELTPI